VSLRAGLALAVLLIARTIQAAAPAGPQVPSLTWTPRSDWVDVKSLGARGDGVAEDTAVTKAACISCNCCGPDSDGRLACTSTSNSPSARPNRVDNAPASSYGGCCDL